MSALLEQIPFYQEGGSIVLILYVISLLASTIVLERLWTLRIDVALPNEWLDQVKEIVRSKGFQGLHQQNLWPKTIGSSLIDQFSKHPTADIAGAREQIDWLLSRNEGQIHRGIGTVGLLAAISPLLGLLGTVAGMITTFQAIAAGGIGDPQALADGIYQALYTTAIGLTLAIPLTICHRILKSRALVVISELEGQLEELWWLHKHSIEQNDAA